MSPKEAATLRARKISSKHTFWLVLSTTPLLASLKSSTVFENTLLFLYALHALVLQFSSSLFSSLERVGSGFDSMNLSKVV